MSLRTFCFTGTGILRSARHLTPWKLDAIYCKVAKKLCEKSDQIAKHIKILLPFPPLNTLKGRESTGRRILTLTAITGASCVEKVLKNHHCTGKASAEGTRFFELEDPAEDRSRLSEWRPAIPIIEGEAPTPLAQM